jgi:hypothetical protein
MAYQAGRLPITALRTIAPGAPLISSAAQAFFNMALIARLYDGTRIAPVSTYGSAYRDWATALVFYKAGQGDRAAAAKAGIDPKLHVSIAYPPGSHGHGTRLDMAFNGHEPDKGNLEFAARYGWTREFGAADRFHFMHDGRTAVSGVRGFDKICLTGRFLNDLHLGTNTAAEHTGRRDKQFIWLVQHYGHMKNTYPDRCKEDGGLRELSGALIMVGSWLVMGCVLSCLFLRTSIGKQENSNCSTDDAPIAAELS